MSSKRQNRRVASLLTTVLLLTFAPLLLGDVYTQVNLTSDVSGLAPNLDPNLKNPWGVSFAAKSPFWVSNQASGNSTLYTSTGSIVPLVVATPPASPTGQVFNGTGQFLEPNGKSPFFLFATLAGTIDGWNPSNATTAAILATRPGAVYTGLALANNGSANYLYAANAAGGIDVFDTSFKPVTLSGTFTDPTLPSGYTPYNIALVGGNLYVTYAQGLNTGPGLGVVSEFDTSGHFIKRVATGGSLDAPWGVALAPASFGRFGGDLLIGNFGSGEISAFDPVSDAFLGTLSSGNGSPIMNSGLWSLSFRAAGSGFNPDALYFTAGINGQKDGLFGEIVLTPEPGTVLVTGLSLAVLFALKRRRTY
jgi:uncharacterized protein (TIGR03118 family)